MIGQEIFIGTVFTAGVLSFFAPCIIPILPIYIGILTGQADGKERKSKMKAVFSSLAFVGGLSTSFVILGFGAGFLGSLISSRLFYIIAGIIVIILGIYHTGLIKLNFLQRERKLELEASSKNSLFGTFLLGFTFSFGWTPCIGPVLGAIIGVSAFGGQPLYGGLLMLVYSIGLAIPFIIIAAFSDVLLGKVKSIRKHFKKIRIAGGILIILMGIALMTDSLNKITIFFT